LDNDGAKFKVMEDDVAGDATTVLNAVGASNGQDFDYALLPPHRAVTGFCYCTIKVH
jgi:hypothetical protein